MQRSRCLPAIDRDDVDAVRRDVHREIFRLRAVARVQLRAVRRGDRQFERAFFHGKMDLQHITLLQRKCMGVLCRSCAPHLANRNRNSSRTSRERRRSPGCCAQGGIRKARRRALPADKRERISFFISVRPFIKNIAPEYTCRPADCKAMPENGLSPRTAVRPTCAGNMFIFSARGQAATHEPRPRRTAHRSPIRIYPARAFPPERPLRWR